jgi:cytidylate kinase
MAVITISRQFGSGGRTLGKMIAEELGYTFADNEIIQRLSKEANVSAKWIRSFEKEAGSKLSRIISKMVSKRWLDRVLAGERGYLDEEIYLDYMVLIIAQIADEGNVVILGRGSQYILDDHPEAFHILLIDQLENRIKFLVEHYEMTQRQAAQLVNYEDMRRSSLYRKLGKKNYNDPELYHLVLNMGKLDLQAAMNLVCTNLGEIQ